MVGGRKDREMSRLDDIISGKGEFKRLGTLSGSYTFKEIAERITCQDGESLSVQAGRMLYSTPRDDVGPYCAVEVGFPSVSPPESWREYFDGDWDTEHHTGSVYGHVPVGLVEEFLEAHGGEAIVAPVDAECVHCGVDQSSGVCSHCGAPMKSG